MDADADAIERRFREKTGKPAPAARKDSTAASGASETEKPAQQSSSTDSQKDAQKDVQKNAQSNAVSANEVKGEKHAAQTQTGEGNSSGAGSKQGN